MRRGMCIACMHACMHALYVSINECMYAHMRICVWPDPTHACIYVGAIPRGRTDRFQDVMETELMHSLSQTNDRRHSVKR